MKEKNVTSREELITFLQERSSYHEVEIGGTFIPEEKGYYLTIQRGSKNRIILNRDMHGAWHSHPPPVDEIFYMQRQNSNYFDKPSQQDLWGFILSPKQKEDIIVGPLYTIQLTKRFEGQPLADYMQRVAKKSKSFLINLGKFDPQYLSILAQAVSIDHLLEKYGKKFDISGRYQDVWVEFATSLGLEVKVSENEIIADKYRGHHSQLKKIIPDRSGTYKAQTGIGKSIYPELIRNIETDIVEVLLPYMNA